MYGQCCRLEDLSEIHDTVKESDARLGKEMYLCLSLTQEASGFVPGLELSRQPNINFRDSGEVDGA